MPKQIVGCSPKERFLQLVDMWNSVEGSLLNKSTIDKMQCIANEASTLVASFPELIGLEYTTKRYDFSKSNSPGVRFP